MQQGEWKGQKPQRFNGSRKHMKPQDALNSHLEPNLSSLGSCGIRIFQQKFSQQYAFKPRVKVYPNSYELTQKQIDLRGKKYLHLNQQQQRIRPERAHVPGGQQTTNQFQNRGIKITGSTALSQTEYCLQNKMQKKIRLQSYTQQRNDVGTSSLGDKAYKYPEYSPHFYNGGGLIPGSTFRPVPQSQKQLQKVKNMPVLTKPNWDVKVKLQQIAEDKRAVNSVDQWEQTILKQANPNWNDPDTFFERMQAKKQTKDQKKGGKK